MTWKPRRIVALLAVVVSGAGWVASASADTNDVFPCVAPPPGLDCSAAPPRRPNVVLIIEDDNGYCHHGFMQGMCTESSLRTGCKKTSDCSPDIDHPTEFCERGYCFKPCLTNNGCDPNASGFTDPGLCTSSAEMEARTGKSALPLRLADQTCRNRTAVNGEFRFDRTAPAPNTADVRMITPHMDALASEGAVFPRAHVGGMECKASRTLLWNGIFNVHLKRRPPAGRGLRQSAPFQTPCDPTDPARFNGVGCYLHRLEGFPRYHTYLWGKGDITKWNTSKLDSDFDQKNGSPDSQGVSGDAEPGDVPSDCTAASACGRQVLEGIPPVDPSGALLGLHMEKVFADIVTDRESDRLTPPNRVNPFFIWYSPNVPHFGAGSPDVFEVWTGAMPRSTLLPWGRISMFDFGVGSLVRGLKERCNCDDGAARSLYESTVLIIINDNGNILANDKRRATENGERTPIVISEPAHHRSPALAPAVYDDYAAGVDLLGTIVSYAQENQNPIVPLKDACGSLQNQTAPPHVVGFDYPFSCNLCRRVRGGDDPCSRLDERLDGGGHVAHIRRVYQSHQSINALNVSHDIRTVLTAPGELGVCSGPGAARTKPIDSPGLGHVRPCRTDAQCPCAPPVPGQPDLCAFRNTAPSHDVCYHGIGGTCAGDAHACMRDHDCSPGKGPCQPPGQLGGRCADRPEFACALDADCADAGLCSSATHTCTNDPGGNYQEFRALHCDSDVDCLPRGICQDAVIKLFRGKSPVDALYDPNWDPDQIRNVYLFDPGYIDPTLKTDLEGCLDDFWLAGWNGSAWTVPSPPGCPF